MAARVDLDRSWPTGGSRIEAVVDALGRRHGLSGEDPPQDGGACVLEGGSQLWTRVFGGWFVKPRRLPKRATLSRSGDGVHLRLESTLGIGVMDGKLRSSYEREFADIVATTGEALGSRP